MMIVVLCVVLATVVSASNSTLALGASNGAVVELNVESYLGLWYQMYADSFVTNTIEKNAYCDTATYTMRDDGKIGVRNYAKQDAPDGKDFVIDGYAYQSNSDVSGELKVHFNPTPGQNVAPFDAPYWVLDLGPVNSDGKYDWAVVSDNLSKFLFVLARDVKTFKSQYEAGVLETLKKQGFTGAFTTPVETYQGDDCVYENSVAAPKAKVAAAGTCEAISDESSCMSSMEGDEACAWCSSGAVGTSCQKQSDAESLPSAVFECTYQEGYAAYSPETPAVSAPKKLSYRQPLTESCNGPHESCCAAPMDDVNNCPDSARTPDCDAKKACCCA